MRMLAAGLAVLFISAAAGFGQDFEAGSAAYKSGDYATALREWRPLAEEGDVVAQVLLGILYYKGQGVPRDDSEAMKWYRLAADQGDATAQYNLGNV